MMIYRGLQMRCAAVLFVSLIGALVIGTPEVAAKEGQSFFDITSRAASIFLGNNDKSAQVIAANKAPAKAQTTKVEDEALLDADKIEPVEEVPPLPQYQAVFPNAAKVKPQMLSPVRISNPRDEIVQVPLNKSRILDLSIEAKDVLVTNPGILDVKLKSSKRAYLLPKGLGSSNVLFMDERGQIVSRIEAHVGVDVDSLNAMIRDVLPGNKVRASSVNDSVVLAGSVRSDADVSRALQLARRFVPYDANVVNLLQVSEEHQVLLKVRVAEMRRDVLKEIGVNTSFNRTFPGSSYVFEWSNPTGATTLTGGGTGSGAMYTGDLSRAGSSDFSMVFNALENNGLVKTLAEPNLTAVTGENASLLAGGEYPIPVFDSDGNVTIEYRPYGVSLSFTPVVLSSGRINMKMNTEVSSISSLRTIAGALVPEMSSRQFSTSVEIPSGGSLMIGGLLENNVTDSVSGVPWIKDVPILGALFRSESFIRKETELVVSLTAYIVEPQSNNQLAYPTDGFAPANDFDRFLFHNLHQIYWRGRKAPPKGTIRGPIGYIMK